MKNLFLISFSFILFSASVHAQENKTSKVLFLRTFNYVGGGVGYNVYMGSEKTKVTRIKPQTFELVDLGAQPTRIWAKTEVERHLDLDLRPDYLYIVRCKVRFGWFWGRPFFETLTTDEFKTLVAKKPYLQKNLKKLGYETSDEFINAYQSIQLSSL